MYSYTVIWPFLTENRDFEVSRTRVFKSEIDLKISGDLFFGPKEVVAMVLSMKANNRPRPGNLP